MGERETIQGRSHAKDCAMVRHPWTHDEFPRDCTCDCAPAPAEAVAVMRQYRSRLNGGPWNHWTELTDGRAQMIADLPRDHELTFEYRDLYAAPLGRAEVGDVDARDAARYRTLAKYAGHAFCQADGFDAWYFNGPVVTLTRVMPTMDQYVDALARPDRERGE